MAGGYGSLGASVIVFSLLGIQRWEKSASVPKAHKNPGALTS